MKSNVTNVYIFYFHSKENIVGVMEQNYQSLGREREFFYLMTHSTHCIYDYMASDIRLRTILIVRKETAAAT